MEKERIGVDFDNGHTDGVTYVKFATLQNAGFKVPGKEEYNNAQAAEVLRMFIEGFETKNDLLLTLVFERAKYVLESR